MREIIAFIDDFDQDYIQELIENNQVSVNKFISNLEKLLIPLRKKKLKIYYSSKSIRNFISFFQNETIQNTYLLSLEEQLHELLENSCLDCNKYKPNQSFRWDYCEQKIYDITNLSLGIITDKIVNESSNKKYILVLPSVATHPYHCRSFISTFQDGFDKSPLFVEIVYYNESLLIQSEIKGNNKFVFNKNNKHGENGKAAHHTNKGYSVSKLYCSIEAAQKLLNDSEYDFRMKPNYCYNYDIDIDKFIVFYYEGDTPQNQFHGFHYETFEEAQKSIPNLIFKELRKKYNI